MASKYNGTTQPNGSIAGAKGAGGATGNQTKPNNAPKGPAGTYTSHYGPGGAGGAGTGAMDSYEDMEQEPGAAPRKKKAKPMKFNSIQKLRDYANKIGAS